MKAFWIYIISKNTNVARNITMPLLEAPTHFDDESSPDNSQAAEFGGVANEIPVTRQLRIHTPEQRQPPNATRGRNTFRAIRLPTIRLYNARTLEQARVGTQANTNPPPRATARRDIYAELEAEVIEAESLIRVGLVPPPVVNLLPIVFPPQVAEPQLDELLRNVTQRTDLHNVEMVRLRVISSITVSLSRLAMFLPRLQHLDLSGSVLCSLRDLGCGLIHLSHLNVSNCGLTSFDGTSGMPALRELIANDNMIWLVGPLTELPMLQQLSARNNRIGELGILTFLAMCPRLSQLDLQGNPVCHLPRYRSTLQRSIPTLRTIDGVPVSVEEETSYPDAPNEGLARSDDNETERVATLNRRNAIISGEGTSSIHSSLTSSESAADTANDNDALSSLSSEHQVPEEGASPEASVSSATSASYDNAPVIATSLSSIRCLRRPATAPIENPSSNSTEFNSTVSIRPASASSPAQYQRSMQSPRTVSSLNIAVSVLDLVRQRRRQRQQNQQAWERGNNENTSSTESSIASS